METPWKTIIQNQFEATLDMFENSLRACPDQLWRVSLWNDPSLSPEFSEFWYVAYHTLFWLDLYLTGAVEGFNPPPPFTLTELNPAGLLPEKQYSREELMTYIQHCRQKCRDTISVLTGKQANRPCTFSWGEVSFAELLIDNMRHVQEHGAQLSMILGQEASSSSHWVSRAKKASTND